MYRFVILALTIGLSACVVEVEPVEDSDQAQLDIADQQLELSGGLDDGQLSQPASDDGDGGGDDSLCGNTWECYCAQFKTPETCTGSCVWWPNRCQPSYE